MATVLRVFSVFVTACLVVGCVTIPGAEPTTADVAANMATADELVRVGKFDGAEAHLLAARSTYVRHSAEWGSLTSKLASVAKVQGDLEKACSYQHELAPGEVLRLPQTREELDAPSGPRSRLIAEAVLAFDQHDLAAAAAALAELRRQVAIGCPSFINVAAAEMLVALHRGDMQTFKTVGAELDRHFERQRIVLKGQETRVPFVVLGLYRRLQARPLAANTPPSLADKLNSLPH